MTGQMRNPDPGQNQKPHVVGQEFEICLSCSSVPVDKVVPGYRSKNNLEEAEKLGVDCYVGSRRGQVEEGVRARRDGDSFGISGCWAGIE